MKVLIVISSVNRLTNLRENFQGNNNVGEYKYKILIIDEESKQLRNENDKLLSNMPHIFYGDKERAEWFKQRFGSSVMPKQVSAFW